MRSPKPCKYPRCGQRYCWLWLSVVISLECAGAVFAADAQTGATSTNLLLIDRFGKPIIASTNEVPASLHPPASVGLGQQVPSTPKGTPVADPVRERIADSKTGRHWFPTTPPVLMPYLGSLDEFGNTAIQPGAVLPIDPHSLFAQQAKYALSEIGLRYQLWQ